MIKGSFSPLQPRRAAGAHDSRERADEAVQKEHQMNHETTSRRVIVGISGASGICYGIRALEMLAQLGVETHLVITKAARATLAYETDMTVTEVRSLASQVHSHDDLGAAISSGSFPVDGMIVAPCSVKTLSGIATSYDDTLLIRAADVTLKERRPLVLMVRETPLHLGHLRLMMQAAEAGAIIMPTVPAFYTRPATIDDIINQTVGRALDQLHLPHPATPRWHVNSRPTGVEALEP